MFHYTVDKIKGPKGYGAAVAMGHKVYTFLNSTKDTIHVTIGHMDVHVFNTMSLLWMKVSPTPPREEGPLEIPSRRHSHTAVLIGYIAYIWGGSTRSGYCNVLYAFDVDTHMWFTPRVSGTVPEARYNHSACVRGKVMFIHGGYIKGEPMFPIKKGDICKLDTTTMVWTLINIGGAAPPASANHSATIVGKQMFVFGGWLVNNNIMRVFDTETNYSMNIPSTQLLPKGRWNHSAFTYNGELYIFGGREFQKNPNDLWKYNPETFSWKEVKPKCKLPYMMPDGCCCIVGNGIILFGGSSDSVFILDLSPSLKTLCKLAVIQYGLEQSELPHNIRWELAAMMNK